MPLQALHIGYRKLAEIKKIPFVTVVGWFSVPPFHYKYVTVLRIDSKKSVAYILTGTFDLRKLRSCMDCGISLLWKSKVISAIQPKVHAETR